MTESQIYECLRPMFPANEYALMPQVRNGTGFTKSPRTADAVAVSLWPSRGIDLHGFEFKDSRADVLKELKDSSKSDEIGKHCAYWWMVASKPGIIKLDELPAMWGLITISDGKAKKARHAPRRQSAPLDLPLIAAILKAAAGAVTGEDDVKRRIDAAVKKRESEIYAEQKRSEERLRADIESGRASLHQAVQGFKDLTGIDIYEETRCRTIYGPGFAKAVKFVMDGGLDNIHAQLQTIRKLCVNVERATTTILGESPCHS